MMCHVWKRVKMWGFSTLFRIFFNVAELRKKEAEIPPKLAQKVSKPTTLLDGATLPVQKINFPGL